MITSFSTPTNPIRTSPIRVALVGVTGYGAAYFDDLKTMVESGRLTWGAVTIINPDQAPEQVEYFKQKAVPIYKDYSDMLASEKGNLDWICIPTGIGWHTRMTIDSLRQGLQVTVEKPLAPTLQDTKKIQMAELETGISVSVGFQYNYQAETWDIKQRLLSGEIGEVLRIDCLACWPRPKAYYARNSWSGHLHDGDSWILDSPLHNALCHLINMILFWSGDELDRCADIEKIQAETYRAKPIESYDTVRTVVKMDSGIEAAVVLSHSTGQQIDPEIHITGTKGKLIWRFSGDYEIVVDGNSTTYAQSEQLEIRKKMFEAIVDRMEGKPARICTSDLAKGTVKWVNAVHDTTEIHDIPERYRKCVKDEAGEEIDAIENFEYFAQCAFREGKTFLELGAPWAVAPKERDLIGYEAFEGKFCPETEFSVKRSSVK